MILGAVITCKYLPSAYSWKFYSIVTGISECPLFQDNINYVSNLCDAYELFLNTKLRLIINIFHCKLKCDVLNRCTEYKLLLTVNWLLENMCYWHYRFNGNTKLIPSNYYTSHLQSQNCNIVVLCEISFTLFG